MKGSKFQRQYDRSRDYLGQIKQLGPQRVLNSLYAVFPIAFEKPEIARKVYERALDHSKALGLKTEGGRFKAHMEVSLLNDGPVTFWLEGEE